MISGLDLSASYIGEVVSINPKIAVIGLGYVGLPVAIAFAKRNAVIGYDISKERVEKLKSGIDYANEVPSSELRHADILFTYDPKDLHAANFFIVAVPTPIDKANKPDLSQLKHATQTVATYLKPNDMVVFESTVYPGTTEEECVPILESISGLRFGKDFSVGYSPERISPGDFEHTFEKVTKVVSANSPEALEIIFNVYNSVVKAGVYKASSIKIAEAAKIIENTQRDLNVALMNELSIIFDRMGIDTLEVLEAAKTKWNFHAFTPGLVGGHCIGVDPYYLTYKAQILGYQPEVILAGRRINDAMGKYIATQTIKKLLCSKSYCPAANIAVLGITFKEDCCDVRNSKVFDIIKEINAYGIPVLAHDPIANIKENQTIKLVPWQDINQVQALIIAVGHRFYREMTVDDFAQKLKPGGIIIDVKGILDKKSLQHVGIEVWRL
ncbi:MAG: nucleotide sugar dehydrogenase [Proteobacteria bacterium]|nr:nucleotide sugar dehydrogenase [Pseudomonadota bacterium]